MRVFGIWLCLVTSLAFGCKESDPKKEDNPGPTDPLATESSTETTTSTATGTTTATDTEADFKPTLALAGFTQNYEESVAAWEVLLGKAKVLGVSALHIQAAPWNEVETSNGVYKLDFFDQYAEAAEGESFSYSLDIGSPLGLGKPGLPDDLTFSTWDDATLLTRYLGYVDAVLGKMPKARYVVVHTESAGSYFGTDHPEELDAFCAMLQKVVAHLHTKAPGVPVGIYGGKPESKALLAKLNQNMDFFGLTYIADRGDVDYQKEFNELLSLASGKPVVVLEAGMPTSTAVGGSEEKQKAFFQFVLDTIAKPSSNVKYASFYLALDEDQAVTRQYVPVLFPDLQGQALEDTIQWFSSLGIFKEDGSPKAGVSVLQKATAP